VDGGKAGFGKRFSGGPAATDTDDGALPGVPSEPAAAGG
jgi:hypothetical protein